MRQRALLVIVATAVWSAGCASLPAGTYYPSPADPNTVRVAHILHRAAVAAGDDPTRYSFAFVKSQHAAAYTDEDATFYITDGLARLPSPVLEAAVAHEVAHEVLDHVGTRRRLALSLNAGFGTAGFFAPGVGLLDFVVNPLVVRAFSRQQELAADQRAIEILRAMGNPAPRRTLAESLRAVDAVLVRTRDDGGSVLDTHPTLEVRLKAPEPLDLGWRKCLPGGCIADALLNDDVLRRWKIQTSAGRIAWTDGTGGALAIGLSFRGLAQALDALNKEP